jgi:hypothetical protein
MAKSATDSAAAKTMAAIPTAIFDMARPLIVARPLSLGRKLDGIGMNAD